eukprot:CAMPEP_0170230228 /NCGR_PEP_ID=MMETSP0116_2-20130129/14845_1 /TAXON_ID=400756 /ORGANISM="Durinskia baltica, Strain CSIRO CS-38" /LENGTH=223 /DNA_ID=CAMNT_0010480993 /DNA_START=61 /DNA_END=732 /DNA_ORIENTATION=-
MANTIGLGNLVSRATTTTTTTTTTTKRTQLAAVPYETCVNVGYEAVVSKPLGVVFGENPDPYYGLVVDDVAEGLNGGKAGLRVGDQLMAINGNVVVGKEFDTVMGLLQSASGQLDLVLYRGPVSSLFTILGNQLGEGEFVRDEGEEEIIIMDENYESPVRIEVKEKKPLSPADLFKAMGKVGKMMFEDNTPPEVKQQKKKQQGFFGIGAETIQLDGNDANTLK